MKTKKLKIYTYHVSHCFVERDKKMEMMTQLYQIGVYAIVNNNPALQLSLLPKDVVNIEKELKKGIASGKISDLIFGREISVYEENGMWKEKID